MTSEARTGVAENWGSLGGPWNRSGVALLSAAPHPPFCPLPHAAAWHPPQIQRLQQGPAGRAEPGVRSVKQQQARVAEGSEHPLPAPPDARGPRHLGKAAMGGPAQPQPPSPPAPPGPSSPTGSPRRQCLCQFQGALPGPRTGGQRAQGRGGPEGRRSSDRSTRRLWGEQVTAGRGREVGGDSPRPGLWVFPAPASLRPWWHLSCHHLPTK